MTNSTPHVISIWLVDPVGGIFVDWPPNTDDAYIYDQTLIPRALATHTARTLGLPILNTLDDPNSTFWVPHDQLAALLGECANIASASASIASEAEIPVDDLNLNFNRIRSAANHAMSIQDAGVCIT